MPSCCILKCGARKMENQPQLSLHRVPKNEALRRKWLKAIGEENINPRHKNWFICSLHFEERYFNRTLDVIRLHDNDVPTIFSASNRKNQESSAVFCETSNIQKSDVSYNSPIKLWKQYTKRRHLVCAYSTDTARKVFKGAKDRYNGITIDSRQEKFNVQKFTENLEESLSTWASQGHKCIWFKVNINDAFCVPILAQKGFNFHHARDEFVMMYKWLPGDSEPNLPPACHTNLGVGALVFNNLNQLLAISEKHYEYPHWKLPGGYVEKGEDIIDAAVREVKEETGVDAIFQSLVTFRHTHNMMFENSDIYVILMMKAISDKIVPSHREVNRCQWMEVEEYCNHPHVHKFNKSIVRTALEYKKRSLKLGIQKKTVQWATYQREMNFLVVEDCNYIDK